ncbi:MAG: hypothetical protein WDW36_004347 [Sanguina aurantia]
MALPDAKMSAQAFDLPFFNKNASEKVAEASKDVGNTAKNITGKVQASAKQVTNDTKRSTSAPVKPFTNTGPDINTATKQNADKAINAVGNVGKKLESSVTQAGDKVKSAAKDTAAAVKGSDVASNMPNLNAAAADVKSSADRASTTVTNGAGGILGKIQSAVTGNPMDDGSARAQNAGNSASSTGRQIQNSAEATGSKIKDVARGAKLELPNVQLPNVQAPDLGGLGAKVSKASDKLGSALKSSVLTDSITKAGPGTAAENTANGPDGKTKFL